ncbi:hypothetical protein [Melghirimyces profundicolus]|nr:hypothetical protein [Melghirimyces profundicolus]
MTPEKQRTHTDNRHRLAYSDEGIRNPGEDNPHAVTSSIQESYGPTPYDREELKREEKISKKDNTGNP